MKLGLPRKPKIEKWIIQDQTIEAVICFIVSFILIFHFLFKPESAVMKAVVDNDPAKIKQMIQVSKGVDDYGPCRQSRSLYTTPLIEAARLGRSAIALELLEAGADVNARDDYGTTPLLAALSRGDIRISLALLERGADPNLSTCLGHGSCTTALRCARRLNNAQLIEKMESVGACADTPWYFPIECFWMNVRPVALLVLTQIMPLVVFIMLCGSFLRRRLRRDPSSH